MNKKIFLVCTIIFLLMFAGIIAVTQETDPFFDIPGEDELDTDEFDFEEFVLPYSGYIYSRETPDWVNPIRWFRSNSGGMALEELGSRFIALRADYALAIDFTEEDVLPDELLSFFEEEYYIEVRMLYEKGIQKRTQWIFREFDGNVRLVAVFAEPASEELNITDVEEIREETVISEISAQVSIETIEEAIEASLEASGDVSVEKIDDASTEEAIETAVNEMIETITQEETIETTTQIPIRVSSGIPAETPAEVHAGDRNIGSAKTRYIIGFVEMYDRNSLLTTEYAFFNDGSRQKIDYTLTDNILTSISVAVAENKSAEDYHLFFIDSFFYNRSMFLRSVERNFYQEGTLSLSDEPLRVALPISAKEAAMSAAFIETRHNTLPDYFGASIININYKIVYTTDIRGRILLQTLYDEEDNVIWVITNTWENDRIISSSKEEGETVLLTEYEYDSGGNKILERNYRDGVLERLVRTDDKTEIEELYLNNVVVLRAVWEDGRKISENRIRNR